VNIQSFHLNNFRALKDNAILFEFISTCIGSNEAGKSATPTANVMEPKLLLKILAKVNGN